MQVQRQKQQRHKQEQQGFSLVELLIVSLLSSVALLAASQSFVSLLKFETSLNTKLQLNEAAILADLAIQNTLHQAKGVALAGQATANSAASNSNLSINLGGGLGTLNFTQLRNSDWLLVKDKNNSKKFNLLHLDIKTYGKGLAYKSHTVGSVADRSDTLVDLVNQISWQFYDASKNTWLRASQVNDFNQVKAVSYFLTLEAPAVKQKQPSYLHLTNSFYFSELSND